MSDERIIEALEGSNKWWRKEFLIEYKDREIYARIEKFLGEKQIIALVGLRRTGKTTIMLKIVKDNLQHLDKTNIVYFSFDEFKDTRINEVIKVYSRLMNKDLCNEKYLLLFDEIQKVENWEEQLKRIYDENPNFKIIISGSESLFIRKKSRESLAGRIYEFQIKTLNFREYLAFKNKKFENINLHKEEILRDFKEFLLSWGFPEIIGKDKDTSEKYIRENVIEKVIYRDIPQILPIKDPAVLDQVLKIIIQDPGEAINLDELSRDIGIARQTISIYIDYLEKSFLIKKLYNYSRNARKTQRSLKKYYPTTIPPSVSGRRDLFGKVFETFIVNQLDAEFFWRDPYKNEVDIIKTSPLKAIEVKSGNIRESDLHPIRKFIDKFHPGEAIVVSYNIEKDLGKKELSIKIIPFYKYLLKEIHRA